MCHLRDIFSVKTTVNITIFFQLVLDVAGFTQDRFVVIKIALEISYPFQVLTVGLLPFDGLRSLLL